MIYFHVQLLLRKQRVIFNGKSSPWTDVKLASCKAVCWVQYFFVININIKDLPEEIESTTIIFAGDTKIFREVTNLTDQNKQEEDLNKLSDWSTKWQLKFNEAKCKILHLEHKNQQLQYTVNNITVTSIKVDTNLGVQTDQELTFMLRVPSTNQQRCLD